MPDQSVFTCWKCRDLGYYRAELPNSGDTGTGSVKCGCGAAESLTASLGLARAVGPSPPPPSCERCDRDGWVEVFGDEGFPVGARDCEACGGSGKSVDIYP